VEVVASLSQGRTAAAQGGLFTYKSVPVIFEPPCIFVNFPLLLYVCKRLINAHRWHMYHHTLLFTNTFLSLVQRSSEYQKRIRNIIYFKCADIECCKKVSVSLKVAHCRNVTVGTNKRSFIIQATIFIVLTRGCSFHRMSYHWCTYKLTI